VGEELRLEAHVHGERADPMMAGTAHPIPIPASQTAQSRARHCHRQIADGSL